MLGGGGAASLGPNSLARGRIYLKKGRGRKRGREMQCGEVICITTVAFQGGQGRNQETRKKMGGKPLPEEKVRKEKRTGSSVFAARQKT